eukprot:4720727-Prymnesium_polylepis.3
MGAGTVYMDVILTPAGPTRRYYAEHGAQYRVLCYWPIFAIHAMLTDDELGDLKVFPEEFFITNVVGSALMINL